MMKRRIPFLITGLAATLSCMGEEAWQSQVVGLQESPNCVTYEGKQIPVIKSADVLVVGSTLGARRPA